MTKQISEDLLDRSLSRRTAIVAGVVCTFLACALWVFVYCLVIARNVSEWDGTFFFVSGVSCFLAAKLTQVSYTLIFNPRGKAFSYLFIFLTGIFFTITGLYAAFALKGKGANLAQPVVMGVLMAGYSYKKM